MKRITTKIIFEEGLHARPASELAKLCQKFESSIKLIKKDVEIDPKSVLGILSIGATKGDEITIQTEGSDEEVAGSALEEFFKKG